MIPSSGANGLKEPMEPSVAGKKIVVTGGAGFLGRVVVAKLRERGCGSGDIFVPRRAQMDLSKAEDVARMFDEARPQIVIHLAATVANQQGRGTAAESFCNNVLMSTQLMEAAGRRGVEKMVCLGSASSYPANASMPLRESDLFNGLPEASRAAHGIAKRLPWIHALACRQQYGLRCIFLVPTNFYGPGDNFGEETSYVIPSLVRKFVEAAEAGAEEVVVRGTGCATRDFLHVEDCAEGIVLALEKYNGTEPVNLGSGTEVGIHEVARRVARVAGFEGRTLWDANYPDGPLRRVLDTSRAQREFGFRARRNLPDGLAETIEWYRQERGRMRASEMRGEKATASRA
jgi:GDP-L-fucose synthase